MLRGEEIMEEILHEVKDETLIKSFNDFISFVEKIDHCFE